MNQDQTTNKPLFPRKLWVYTNFDCNLSCTYCVARSTPKTPRKPIGIENATRLLDEAVGLGFEEVFFTGGEPFILDEIYGMLEYASQRLPTTVLTNAMILRGPRLERLKVIQNPNLKVQVSLDGASPEDHDPYRGAGTWQKTVEGIETLLDSGFRVSLSTTETPANQEHLAQICEFHTHLGIPEEDHFVRPLARRGFSDEGLEVSKNNLVPEVTATIDGIFWHPLSTDSDMQVSPSLFPLASSVECIQSQLTLIQAKNGADLTTFT